MTTLGFVHNADELAAALDARARRQYPFAIANGINRTLDEVRLEGRRRLQTQFRFRSSRTRQFFESFVSIAEDQRARKERLAGAVGIQPPLRGSARTIRQVGILTKFHAGGTFTPQGGLPKAVSTDYLRGRYPGGIPQSLYPKALGLLERKRIEGGESIAGLRAREGRGRGTTVVSLRGKRRTFAFDYRFQQVQNADVYGVWQRQGRGRDSEVFLLWHYARRIRIPKLLTFLADGERLVRQRLGLNIEGQLAFALNEGKQYRARQFERAARSRGRI